MLFWRWHGKVSDTEPDDDFVSKFSIMLCNVVHVAFLWNLLELVYFFSSDYVSSPQPHKKHKKRKHKKHKKHRESGNGGQSSDTGQSELVEATDSLTGKPQLKLKIKIGGQTLRTKRYTLLLMLFFHILCSRVQSKCNHDNLPISPPSTTNSKMCRCTPKLKFLMSFQGHLKTKCA